MSVWKRVARVAVKVAVYACENHDEVKRIVDKLKQDKAQE